MASELKPCPFCGGKAEPAPSMNGLEAVYHPNEACIAGGTQFKELWQSRALPEGETGEWTLPEVTDETVQEFVWLGKKIESKYMAPEVKRQLIEEFLLELSPRVPDSQKGGA